MNDFVEQQQVVGFFSYKGGVGRTVTLCNVSLALLQKMFEETDAPHGILSVDFDLAAPGILPILGLEPRRSEIFQPLLKNDVGMEDSIAEDCVQLTLEGRDIPLHIFAENKPEPDAIEMANKIFCDTGHPGAMTFAFNYLKERAREDFEAPFTFLDLGSGFGALASHVFGLLDHLVLTIRGDRQHRQSLPALLEGFEEVFEFEHRPSVHVLLNQIPDSWMGDEDPEFLQFMEDTKLRAFLEHEGDSEDVQQQRTLQKVPLIRSALTHETVLYPKSWKFTNGGGESNSQQIRQAEGADEVALRDAAWAIAESILERGAE